MMSGAMGGFGMGFGILGFFIMILFWGLIIAGIVFAVRWIMSSGTLKPSGEHDAPVEILKRRYAKGEIDRQEFVTRKQELL
ncbi:MAG TPA: SHOCT domain-containing protein [Terriglobales bacterium]|nr:SHOCT domain-containing protein [Terriglobales bacterium]